MAATITTSNFGKWGRRSQVQTHNSNQYNLVRSRVLLGKRGADKAKHHSEVEEHLEAVAKLGARCSRNDRNTFKA